MQINDENNAFHYQYDDLDKQILELLIQDAKTPYTDIAKRLVVSPGTIHVRMKKLEQLGVVKKATLLLDESRLGYDLTVFIGIYLKSSDMYESVIKDLKKIPEVVEAYYTTGEYSIFVKLLCKNTKHMYDVLTHNIQKIKGIQRTESLICLENSIHRQIQL